MNPFVKQKLVPIDGIKNENARAITGQIDPWQRKKSWLCLLMFVIGATSSIDYSLVGRVTVAETIAFVMIPFLWVTGSQSYINDNFKKAVGLLALMFIGVAASDIINQNYFLFSARSLARPVFMLGFLLFFIPVLVRDPLSLVYLVYGRVISGVINYFRPSEFQSESAVDATTYSGIVFRVEPLISTIAIAFAVYIYPRSRILAATSFLAGGATVVLVGGSRSAIIIWALAAAIIIAIKFLKSKYSRRIQITKTRLVGLAAVLVLTLTLVYFLYVWAAPQGLLGEVQERKIQQQQTTVFGTSPLGFILAGRPQVYGAILGALDRPLFGFGSWRRDLTDIYVIEAIGSVGTDPKILDRFSQGASAGGAGHSVVFLAWVENGLLPMLAYFIIFCIIMRALIFNIRFENRLSPYFIYTAVAFSWAFFFSPPGVGVRFTMGLFLAFYVVFMDRRRPLAPMAVMP